MLLGWSTELILFSCYKWKVSAACILYSWSLTNFDNHQLFLPWEHPESFPRLRPPPLLHLEIRKELEVSKQWPGTTVYNPKSFNHPYAQILFLHWHYLLQSTVPCRKRLARTLPYLQDLWAPFWDLHLSTATEIWEGSPQMQWIMHVFHLCSRIPSLC